VLWVNNTTTRRRPYVYNIVGVHGNGPNGDGQNPKTEALRAEEQSSNG